MTPDAAVEAGALALFGEKYGEEVRVVSMGLPESETHIYSTELCGGTHVRRTGDIGAFRIVGEAAVAAGVRRVECVTGEAAMDYSRTRDRQLQDIANSLKTSAADAVGRVVSLLDERKKLEREVSELRRQLAAGGGGASSPDAKTIAGISFASRVLEGVPPKELKPLADQLKKTGRVRCCCRCRG